MSDDPKTQRVPILEVAISGDLDVWSAPSVNHLLDEAIALAPGQLIIDLAGCPSIDASGILLLLEAHRRTMRYGGIVALRSPSARLQRNLRLARVDRVLHILAPCPSTFDDEQGRHQP
jgi:anti-anti-sigma factor